MSANHAHKTRRREGGYALIIMLAILIAGSLYALVSRLNSTTMQAERVNDTARSLQMAKEALLGYAATYREAYPDGGNNKVFGYGYLPCPDISTDDGVANFIGAEASSCNSDEQMAIGLLPTKTLGLPDLRDSDGNCLWYAVSGTHKSNPKTSATKLGILNWDTKGQFKIVDGQGNVLEDPAELTPSKARGGAVAIIFAPGAPLSLAGNDQGSARIQVANKPCNTDSSQAIAYLESLGTPFTHGIKKDGSDATISNDQLAWINTKELFERIQKRSDFASYLNTGMQAIASYLTSYPPTAITPTRNLPDGIKLALPAPTTLPDSAENFYTQWRDHFAYQTCAPNCTSSNRYTVNGASCTGVLVWSGKGTNTPRTSTNLSDYFEDALNLVSGGTKTINIAATQYASTTPGQDLVFCLGSTVEGFSSFQSVQSNGSDAVTITPPSGSNTSQLTLGRLVTIPSGINVYGCTWHSQGLDLSPGWRIYFRFNIQERGAGFTFTLADVTTNTAMPNMCGAGGNSLGYSGNNGITSPINSPKLAIEFDTSETANRADPSNNHAAFVFWAGSSRTDDLDNKHGECATDVTPNLPCNPTAVPGIKNISALTSSNSGLARPAGDVYVRIDLIPVSPATSPPTYTMTAYITDQTTVKSLCELDTLESDVADVSTCVSATGIPIPPTISQSLQTSMVYAYPGFTVGLSSSGSNSTQQIIIDNFKANSR